MGFYSGARMTIAHLRDPEDRLRDLLSTLTILHKKLRMYNTCITIDQTRTLDTIEPVFSLIVQWRTDYGDLLRDIFEELKKQHRETFKLASLLNHLGCFMGWRQQELNCSVTYKGGMYTPKGINLSAIHFFFSKDDDGFSFAQLRLLPHAHETRLAANQIAHEFLREHLTAICCAIGGIESHFQYTPQGSEHDEDE